MPYVEDYYEQPKDYPVTEENPLREALEQIKNKIERDIPHLYKHTKVWQIANMALEK